MEASVLLRLSVPQISCFRAAAIHLGISTVIAATIIAVMLLLWYPPPFFGAMSGQKLALLIVGIDLAIGPLVTLIVFDSGKKGIVFDLAVIALLQSAALCYGIYAIHSGRPVFIAFVENEFIVVSAAQIEDQAFAAARPEFRKRPETGPVVVAAIAPSESSQRVDLFFAGLAGLGVQDLPQYYVPYVERSAMALAAARPLDRLELTLEQKAELDRAIAHSGRSPRELRFLPVRTEYAKLTALLDGSTGNVLEFVAIPSGG